MDKINVLPDDLLVKILTFLPTKVAVSTSILSKRWEFLWMWLPKLGYTSSGSKPGLGDFVNKNLPLHRAPVIESLRLDTNILDISPEDIRLWVDIAVSRHIREMEISYCSHIDENIFPSSLFTCNSLVTLKLTSLNLTDVPSVAVGCLHSLKSLQLVGVRFADQYVLQDLLSICPVLEDLWVYFFHMDMRAFTIIVPYLQSLSLFIPAYWGLDGYEIDTPSLEYLKLEDWNDLDYYSLISNMPKLKEAYIDVRCCIFKSVRPMPPITSVKRLTICSEALYGDGIVFNQLEHLNLCVCKKDSSNLVGQLLKDSPNLRVLDISLVEDHEVDERDGMVCWNQPSSVPECLLSSLQIINWSSYYGRPQDRDIAVYMLKNACHLETATFLASSSVYSVPYLKMIKELALSSRVSNSCELIYLLKKTEHSILFLDDLGSCCISHILTSFF